MEKQKRILPHKTYFGEMSRELHTFEKKAKFEGTPSKELVGWLEEEIKNYKKSKSRLIKQNKLMDIICLAMQISRREKIDLDQAWERWCGSHRNTSRDNLFSL